MLHTLGRGGEAEELGHKVCSSPTMVGTLTLLLDGVPNYHELVEAIGLFTCRIATLQQTQLEAPRAIRQ